MTRPVSIALATYNGARYLTAQLDSLVAQTLQPVEIVVCDDDSTDETRAIVADYARGCPIPIRIVHNQPRLGWRANFIKASGLCTGTLIAFCDQDDVWHPDKLKRLAAAFETPGVTMAYHDLRLVDGELRPIGGSPHPRIAALSPPLAVDGWLNALGFTMMFDAALLRFWSLWPSSADKHDPQVPAAHDQWVIFLASMLGSVAYLDVALADYRQHGANAVGLAATGAAERPAADVTAYIGSRLRVIANRLDLIAAMKALDPSSAGALSAGAAVHRRYRDLLAARMKLHDGSASPAARLASFAGLMVRGGYGGGPWRLPPGALARDAAVSLLGPRATVRLGRMRRGSLATTPR